MLGMWYAPADVVVVLYTIPVSAPVALTAPPAMTPPELSATVPPIAPRSDWLAAGFAATSARIPLARITWENRSLYILTSSQA